MIYLKFSLIIVSAFTVAACVADTAPSMTSLEIQAIQSKEFEVNKEIAFKSVVSVFQDLGYIIQSADLETGFITSSSATKNTTDFGQMLVGVRSNQTTLATAFVDDIRQNLTKIRLNFTISSQASGAYGQNNKNDTVIYDTETYQNAFDKIGEAIFIRVQSE